jgi:hypothetical protein
VRSCPSGGWLRGDTSRRRARARCARQSVLTSTAARLVGPTDRPTESATTARTVSR